MHQQDPQSSGPGDASPGASAASSDAPLAMQPDAARGVQACHDLSATGGENSSPGTASGRRRRGNYDVIVALFCGMLLISNIGAVKLIELGPWQVTLGGWHVALGPLITDGGAILFPLTYVLGDLLAEVYGWARARRAIIVGFVLGALASVVFYLVQLLPPAADWDGQDAFERILGFVPRIVIASLAGYLVGQLLNAYVLVWMKRRFGTRHLWVRLLGSTLVGELADTTVFCFVAFFGVITGATWVNYVVVGYLYKCAVEAICLPITYRVIAFVRRREPVDVLTG